MAYIRTYPLPNSAILRVNAEKDRINVSPEYQRRGDIWTLEKQQLLIDSILNDYDVPKLYFHAFNPDQKKAYPDFDYAIIDGRQRLEAIWNFADDRFRISDDFVYLRDRTISAKNLYYSELGSKFPKLKIRFDSYTLPIICIETDDLHLIEDMFSRLNEAVPLNAAEKRNAIGGPMAQAIRDLAAHPFFTEKVKFSDSRLQFRESSARVLFLEHSIITSNKIVDTKKPYLDDMVKKYKMGKYEILQDIFKKTSNVLTNLCNVFDDNDPLLRAQSSIPIYFLTMRTALLSNSQDEITREKIVGFYKELNINREIASKDIASANFDLLEYDRMSQQGTNDAVSIRERTRIICDYLHVVSASNLLIF
jgi:hypothetical protein